MPKITLCVAEEKLALDLREIEFWEDAVCCPI